MPMIYVDWLSGRSREQKQELAEVFTRELARIGGCALEHIQIVFSDVKRPGWVVAGVLGDEPAA